MADYILLNACQAGNEVFVFCAVGITNSSGHLFYWNTDIALIHKGKR